MIINNLHSPDSSKAIKAKNEKIAKTKTIPTFAAHLRNKNEEQSLGSIWSCPVIDDFLEFFVRLGKSRLRSLRAAHYGSFPIVNIDSVAFNIYNAHA